MGYPPIIQYRIFHNPSIFYTPFLPFWRSTIALAETQDLLMLRLSSLRRLQRVRVVSLGDGLERISDLEPKNQPDFGWLTPPFFRGST